jgi:hypothetical protein
MKINVQLLWLHMQQNMTRSFSHLSEKVASVIDKCDSSKNDTRIESSYHVKSY